MTTERPQHEWLIELLRGFAALMVVYNHYAPLAGGGPGLLKFTFTGVDLFFVISGFVFAPYLLGKPLAPVPFLIRRVFRLYPLYLVALLAYVGLRWSEGKAIDYVLRHALFLHTLESREIAFYYNAAFWSLPPEIEFYLLLPLLAVAVKGRVSFALAALAALCLHLVLAYLAPPVAGAMNAWAFLTVHLPGLLIEFFLGVAAWLVVAAAPKRHVRAALVLSGLLLWLSLATLFSVVGDPGIVANAALRGNMGMFVAIAFALMVGGWVGCIAAPPLWSRQIALWAGNLSYGVYLFHNAMPTAFGGLRDGLSAGIFVSLCVACTLLLAWLLHVTIEAPLREYGRRLALRAG